MGESSASAEVPKQLNKLLGANTVQFHLAYPLPGLKCTQGPGKCGLPYPGVLKTTGGTPNHKAERLANRIAYYHWVEPDAGAAKKAVKDTLDFLHWQVARTGHQCIGDANEALTPSHGPIWWRAMTSLRITTSALASRGGDYSTLADSALGWILGHFAICKLGEIPSGVNAGKVLLPGARWKNPGPAPFRVETPEDDGKGYPKDTSTDQVTNVVYQLIENGAVSWKLPPRYFQLSQDRPDIAGAALARQIVDFGVGFGDPATARLADLRSEMLVERYENGHRAWFPNGMPFAHNPALEGWADYDTNELCLSSIVGAKAPPHFKGEPKTTEVKAVKPGKPETPEQPETPVA